MSSLLKNIALSLLASALLVGYAWAEDPEAGMDYESQLLAIITSGVKVSNGSNLPSDQAVVMQRIANKLRSHKMLLKNVVYRPDHNTIRVTWSDGPNVDVVKVTYRVEHDRVITNSLYADKKQILDLKVMYRRKDGEYDYIHMANLATGNTSPVVTTDHTIGESFVYDQKLPPEKCSFCHVLAKNDGSNSGVFFRRYQENTGQVIPKVSGLLHTSSFTAMAQSTAHELGLAPMQEGFDLVNYSATDDGLSLEGAKVLRTLIELPQLIEILATDNGRSTCVVIDTGAQMAANGFGRNDFICADNRAKLLHVRLTNRLMTGSSRPREFTEPYFTN